MLSESRSIFANGTYRLLFSVTGTRVNDKKAAHFIHRLRFAMRAITMLHLRPHSRPISRAPMMVGHESKENGSAMTEKEERLARDRAEIAARVASFRQTQQKFEREREEYYETTLANAVNGTNRPSFWR
jgi:hypothetical protein